ncbi:MAG: CsbD family protein [Shimia sp.]
MNWDIVKGNWKEYKGKAQQQWGKLTDDELTQAQGDRQELVGLVQQKYGYTKDEAEREVDQFFAKAA